MKRILSYLLIWIYATIMIKPVMPTLADLGGHILNYSEHVATVHHEHGENHVHSEYIEEAKKNTPGEDPYNNTLKKSYSSNEHIIFATLQDLLTPEFPSVHLNYIPHCLPVISFKDDFRPPIAFAPLA